MDKIFHETVTFGLTHSLIIGHKPEGVTIDQLYRKMEEDKHDIEKFGLFERATPNYTTYYPDVTEEDLNPKDSEFIEPVFRMLSNVTVLSRWNPIYFPADVLKSSMYKLIGQTINIDHEMAIGNAIGVIKSVEWQNAYTTGGVKVPAGINGIFKIDGKANPRLARGIMMDPPSIHSNSVTVTFAWKKSHPKMPDDEFYTKAGTFDDKGKLIQKIATLIETYHEASLVSHGADPFAQKVDEKGKIVNPGYAGSRYKFNDQTIDNNNESNHYVYVDFKQFSEYNPDTETVGIIHTNQNIGNMKEFLSFLETLFGLEAKSLTEENYEEKLQEFKIAQALALTEASKEKPIKILDLEGLTAIETEVTSLREKLSKVPENVQDKIALAETGKAVVSDLRDEVTRLYTLAAGDGKTDAAILAVIAGADYNTLKALNKQYETATEELFANTCDDCGSTNVTRASAKPSEEGGGHVVPTDAELIAGFTEVKEVKVPKLLQNPK